MTTMDSLEHGNPDNARTPDQIMTDAEQGFELSHAFVPHDADYIRLGAAAMLNEGAGALLYDKLRSLGVTDDQIDEWAEKGLLEENLQKLAPYELRAIRRRVQRITNSDPHAQNAIENEIFFTDRDTGRTKND